MKITSVRIQNFKCIEDSGVFSIAPVTCLVGKNESGKTAILQALHKLNPETPGLDKFDPLTMYPRRRLSSYKERHASDPDNVLTTIWELDDSDLEALSSKLGEEAVTKRTIEIRKGYENCLSWDVQIDEHKVIEHYLNSSGISLEGFEDLRGAETIKEILDTIDAHIARLEDDLSPEGSAEVGPQRKIELLGTLRTTFTKAFGDNPDPVEVASNILETKLPRFLYFSEYQKMPGQVAVADLQKKISEGRVGMGDSIFLALLGLAGSSIDEIGDMKKYEALKAELEAISSRLSDVIFEYWTQNRHLDIEFEFNHALPEDPAPFNSGHIFRTRIRNNRHRVTVSFDERSTGFVWFFSFLVWFSQVRKNYGENLIILLDEPALNLHAKAQADLLRYIEEKLRPHHQVIYTTHSPFMINPEDILSVRTVEDRITDASVEGTKVGDQVFSADADTLFPLQRVLGYEIAQTLFIGKNTLIVEGPSDVLYLKWFSQKLQQSGGEHLDPRWVITPCGGVDKMMSFIKLFGANGLNIVALVDYAEDQKRKIQRFRDSKIIDSSRILSAETYSDGLEADVEDILGRTMYFNIVNQCYNLTGNDAISDAKPTGASSRVVIEVEEYLLANGIVDAHEFNHYRPAEYLMVHGAELGEGLLGVEGALDRFEQLFKDVNSFLEK